MLATALLIATAAAQEPITWEAAELFRDDQIAGFGESLAVGDFDGDGQRELAIGHPDQQRFHLLTLDGGFEDAQTLIAPDDQPRFSRALCAGDVDGDGLDDLVVTADSRNNHSPEPALLYRGGADGLQDPEVLPLPDDWGTRALGEGCLVADLDADGRAEILLADPREGGGLLLYAGGAHPSAEKAPGMDDSLCETLIAGDWNADGYEDLACAGEVSPGTTALWLHPGSRDGLDEDPVIHFLDGLGAQLTLASTDVDDDGYPDLILGMPQASDPGAVLVLWGDPEGLDPEVGQRLEGEEGLADFGVAVSTPGDLDGDGAPELLIGASEEGGGVIHAYATSRRGIGELLWTLPVAGGAPTRLLGAGDLDGDASPDLLISSPGFVEVVLGTPESCETPSTFYLDADHDGFGDPESGLSACSRPDDHVDNDLDCDDDDPDTNPGVAELCDGADNDCDGETDEEPQDGKRYGLDEDDDGYTTGIHAFCEDPGSPWISASTTSDCDDSDPAVNPGVEEVPGDGVDNDCLGGDEGLEHFTTASALTGEEGGISCSSASRHVGWGWMWALGALIALRGRSTRRGSPRPPTPSSSHRGGGRP